jgi:WASH complex subunit 7
MLAYRISNLFKTAVYLHLSVGVPLKKAFIAPLFQCVEMLKAVAATFHRRSAMIGQSILHMADLLHFQLTRALLPVKVGFY